MKKRKNFSKILYFVVLISFIIPTIFLTVKIILLKNGIITDRREIPDFTLMLLECILGIAAIHLPSLLEKKFNFNVPKTMYILYVIFLYCAIFLGEVRNFYYKIPFWDTILHAMSSLMLGFFGFIVVDLLNRHKGTAVNLSPIFVAVFAFCFAATIGSVWEIYEYSIDHFFFTNMQKFRLPGKGVLEGHAALGDTMKDIIVDCTGAFIATFIGFINLLREKKKKEKSDEQIEE